MPNPRQLITSPPKVSNPIPLPHETPGWGWNTPIDMLIGAVTGGGEDPGQTPENLGAMLAAGIPIIPAIAKMRGVVDTARKGLMAPEAAGMIRTGPGRLQNPQFSMKDFRAIPYKYLHGQKELPGMRKLHAVVANDKYKQSLDAALEAADTPPPIPWSKRIQSESFPELKWGGEYKDQLLPEMPNWWMQGEQDVPLENFMELQDELRRLEQLHSVEGAGARGLIKKTVMSQEPGGYWNDTTGEMGIGVPTMKRTLPHEFKHARDTFSGFQTNESYPLLPNFQYAQYRSHPKEVRAWGAGEADLFKRNSEFAGQPTLMGIDDLEQGAALEQQRLGGLMKAEEKVPKYNSGPKFEPQYGVLRGDFVTQPGFNPNDMYPKQTRGDPHWEAAFRTAYPPLTTDPWRPVGLDAIMAALQAKGRK